MFLDYLPIYVPRYIASIYLYLSLPIYPAYVACLCIDRIAQGKRHRHLGQPAPACIPGQPAQPAQASQQSQPTSPAARTGPQAKGPASPVLARWRRVPHQPRPRHTLTQQARSPARYSSPGQPRPRPCPSASNPSASNPSASTAQQRGEDPQRGQASQPAQAQGATWSSLM